MFNDKAWYTIFFVLAVICAALTIAGIWVAVHFISKWW